jgi:hypothetical protein
MKSEFVFAISAFFAHQGNGIELLKFSFGDADDWWGKPEAVRGRRKTVALWLSCLRGGCIMGCIFVPE